MHLVISMTAIALVGGTKIEVAEGEQFFCLKPLTLGVHFLTFLVLADFATTRKFISTTSPFLKLLERRKRLSTIRMITEEQDLCVS